MNSLPELSVVIIHNLENVLDPERLRIGTGGKRYETPREKGTGQLSGFLCRFLRVL